MPREPRRILKEGRNQKFIKKRRPREPLLLYIKFYNAGREMKTLERQSWSGWLTAVGSWSGERQKGDHESTAVGKELGNNEHKTRLRSEVTQLGTHNAPITRFLSAFLL